VFPDPASVERLLGSVLMEQDEEWQAAVRCYWVLDPAYLLTFFGLDPRKTGPERITFRFHQFGCCAVSADRRARKTRIESAQFVAFNPDLFPLFADSRYAIRCNRRQKRPFTDHGRAAKLSPPSQPWLRARSPDSSRLRRNGGCGAASCSPGGLAPQALAAGYSSRRCQP